jgi:hypothetical protein
VDPDLPHAKQSIRFNIDVAFNQKYMIQKNLKFDWGFFTFLRKFHSQILNSWVMIHSLQLAGPSGLVPAHTWSWPFLLQNS